MITNTAQQQTDRRNRSNLLTTFQLVADVTGASGGSPEETSAAAVRVAVGWLGSKFPLSLPSTAMNLAGFELDHLGLEHVLAVSIPSRGVWSARLVHPDAPFQGRPAVAGRTWTTDLALQRSASGVRFAVRVFCASAPYAQDPVILSRPRVVRDMARLVGLQDVRPLDGLPWELQSEEDLALFYNLLISPRRTLPVVMLTQPIPGALWGKVAPYLLDHEALARDSLGIAHIVCMPAELGYSWTQRVTKTWSAFAGTVRTYHPGLEFETGTPFAHPLVLADRVLFWAHEELEGEAAFAAFLVNKLQRQASTRPLDLGGCLFAADARSLQTTLERERIEREFGQRANHDAAATLREQLAALQHAHEAELAALLEQMHEIEEGRDVALQMADETETELDRTRRETHSLRVQNNALRLALEASKQGASADADTPIPETLAELPEWVEQYLTGRVFLHPRALQGIKRSQYEDADLVYQALLLLAREYRNMRLGIDGAEQTWNERRTALGLQFSRSISDSRAGEQGQEYFINYPLGTKRRIFIEFHLRKGATKEERFCLRIYFFWDAETEQVVVAWLPNHLETRAT